MSDHDQSLSPADLAALDALLESGMDVTAASAAHPDRADRIARVATIFNLLDTAPATDRALADVTFARVMQARRNQAAPAELSLTPDDSEALEAWIMHGYDAEQVASSLRDRARRHQALAAAATGVPNVDGAAPRVERTLGHIQSWIDAQSESLAFGRPRRRSRPGIRLADIVSVAAVVLIGCSVVFPVLGALTQRQRRSVCMANLGNTAVAFSSYANSNRDSLPMATASLGGGKWWDVSSAHSNSANLYTLARESYTTLANLACPGNPAAPTAPASTDARDWRRLEEISYSFQLVVGPARPNWSSGPRTVILADRSPVVLRAFRGEMIDPDANAPNHAGTGQHILSNDASVLWATTPYLQNRDNIWLPRSLEVRVRQISGRQIEPLTGHELPAAADDTCLGP